MIVSPLLNIYQFVFVELFQKLVRKQNGEIKNSKSQF